MVKTTYLHCVLVLCYNKFNNILSNEVAWNICMVSICLLTYVVIKNIKLNKKFLFTRWLDVVSFKNFLHMTILSVRISYIWILVQIGKYCCRFCRASCKWLRTRLLSSLSKKTMLTFSPTPFVLWWRNISLLIISGVPIPILDSSIPSIRVESRDTRFSKFPNFGRNSNSEKKFNILSFYFSM